jgi:hypothetical protein
MNMPLHKGRNLNTSQKYENAIMSLHCEPSPQEIASNNRAKRISQLYAEWSEANPGHSKESGMLKYSQICDEKRR